ncbi:SurA N-terminal domain-containing protein [Streptomyces fuscigenes]|uniref:SurA N-terminal domain-containing protein n=1 Tax=Streptomyces fuscigenes TaxID=1528880 RepID=UPI001F42FC50|nr:SurA N-terminal domain-containing protein [Streptomyces fuscigenes]MCF3963821.1 SurA N-terminal domain-containing protein [Streptomyces fuscigenes]
MNRLKRPNSRRSSVLSLSAALAAGLPLLAACGSAAHPGAAAVVGGQRIPVSSLQAQVDDVRTAQQASPQAAQLIGNSAQLSQAKLNGMIFDRILDRAAKDTGVSASRHEIQTARQQAAAAQPGGEKQLEATLLQQGALTPAQIDDAVRRDVLMTKVAKAVGGDTTTPAGQQKLLAVLTKTSKDLHVDVNPRYGTWDNSKVALGNTKTDWIKQVSGQAPDQVPTDA